MCSLIVLSGFDARFPILVAANRDELRGRKSSPPGLWVGERHRVLSPRDKKAGGTWIGVDETGRFAALTNLIGETENDRAPTRGRLVHLALDSDGGIDGAIEAVADEVEAGDDNGFQLLVADGHRTRVLTHPSGAGQSGLQFEQWTDDPHIVAISNEHRPGELELGDHIGKATAPELALDKRLDALADLARHRGRDAPEGDAGLPHRILKIGDPAYGTVSSSLIAVPDDDIRDLVWRFAAGPPDATPYKDYGNLARRLVES